MISKPGGKIFAGRLGWGLADQGLSSITNMALSVFVARSVTIGAFGIFALAFATYTLMLGFARAVCADPMMVRYSRVALPAWKSAASEATGVALVIGALGGLLSATVGVLLGGGNGDSFVILGACLPGLIVQDIWRFSFFAIGRGRDAFLNDLVWASLLGLSLWALTVVDAAHLSAVLLAWGVAATFAAGAGAIQAATFPRVRALRHWNTTHRDLIPRYIGEFGAMTGATNASVYGVSLIAGLAAAAAFRGAQVALGPINVVFMAASLIAVPEAAALLAGNRSRYVPVAGIMSACLAGLAITWGIFGLLLPPRWGRELLGDSWFPARTVLLPLSLSWAATAAALGANAGLRALAAVRESFRARAISSALVVAFTLGGAFAGGAEGAAWGMAVATAASALVWWTYLRSAMRQHAVVPS